MAREPRRDVISKGPLSPPSFRKPPKSRTASLSIRDLRAVPVDGRTKEGKRVADRLDWMELKRKQFEQDADADFEQVKRELDDIQFYNLDQWPADVKTARAGQNASNGLPPVPARPCLVLDKTRESVSQVLNEAHEADLGIEITPADDFESLVGPIDEAEIELREGLARRIQRESQADNARLWGFERGVVAGRGYWGVMTRDVKVNINQPVTAAAGDQEIFVQGFYNQFAVTLDASCDEPDGSDAERAWIGAWMPFEEYKAKYPDAADRRNVISRLTDSHFIQLGNEAPKWFKTSGELRLVYVVDHFYKVRETRDLAQMPDGTWAWQDELPKGAPKPLSVREVENVTVKWAKIDGANPEPLEETDWLGPDIPIIKVTGEPLQPHDNERRAQGLIRPARDSQQGRNAMGSKLVETIALQPIPPTTMAAGQDEGFEQEWDLSTTRTLGRLHYNQRDSEGNQAPPPFATPREAPIQAISAAFAMFEQTMQSAMRTHDPSLGKVQPSLRSGKAVNALVAQSQRSTSNFMANFTRSVRREAQIINNLLYPVYGRRPGRIARILSKTGEPMTVTVADPSATPQPPIPGQPPAPQPPQYKLTENANFNVALKVTRNLDTRRQEESEFLSALIQAEPQMMAVYGDLLFKNLDVPGHQELAERAKLMLAPPIQQALAAKANGGQPMDPQAQQQIAQAHQMVTEAGQKIQQLQLEKQGKVVEMQGRANIEQMRITADADQAAKDREVKIAVAELGAKVDRLQLFMEERARLGSQAHEVGMAAMGNIHDQQQTAQQAEHDAAASQQDHAQALEQGQQAAALQPSPAAPQGGDNASSQ